ncbi:MAG: phytoene dehydrogenase-like protein [Arcticibacterium sp.]|jgi:phytoene dehydrogenase-like protein
MREKLKKYYDVGIVGGGHNGLVAACYLAQAGKSVVVLEKNNYIGGATTSQKTFPEFEAYLSRYSYLVSLFPKEIVEELGLNINLLKREVASFTPYGSSEGLLISNLSDEVSKASVLDLGFGVSEWEGYQKIQALQTRFAELVWESFLSPLKPKSEWKEYFERHGEAALWLAMVEKPIGELIEHYVKSDVLRGVLLTDAKIGVESHAHDKSLLQNKTFLYHIVGNKTGEWRVPEGGMGALVAELYKKAMALGVDFEVNATVEQIEEHVVLVDGQFIKCDHVLLNAAPQLLQKLVPEFLKKKYGFQKSMYEAQDGTAFKINILLNRLPKLNANVSPEEAFAGTFHINQTYSQQEKAYLETLEGKIPEAFSCEMYCHTLTDQSILSEDLKLKGYHTITVFGLDLPFRLFDKSSNEKLKAIVWEKFLNGINSFLEEPFESCIAVNSRNELCFECKSALDLEHDLGLPKGNIFHNDLSWFYAESDADIDKWGVETVFPWINICGSGAMRGGAVSGIPGRNAAMRILSK